MIKTYIDKLIENLPDSIKKREKPQFIHLVLDGGIFNGSYMIGALYFLKEMEQRHYIKITKISGCSIGSLSAFLYLIDQLDLFSEKYNDFCETLKKTYTLREIKELATLLKEKTPDNICEQINGKLYITYYHIKKKKKIIKSQYKTKEELIDVLIRSCFVPFIIDGNFLYKQKYLDGINPYFFPKEKGIKIMYLDLFGTDKISYLFNVKNEKSNFHRVLSGLLDIHNFFIKQTATPMCSYVEDWNWSHFLNHQLKIGFERVFLYMIYFLVFIKTYISTEMESSLLYRFLSKMAYELYVLLLETYTL